MIMKRKSINEGTAARPLSQEFLLAAFIILVIAVSRLMIDLPNFKPVMAIALFSGFLFQRQAIGFFSITVGMLVSDTLVGFYEWQLAMVVYAALLTPMIGGWVLRRWNDDGYKFATGVLGFSGLAAINFYVLTTLAVWGFTSWYPTTWAGLASAFAMGLPFLKWTLLGNSVFAAALFGSWALIPQVGFLQAKVPAEISKL